MGTRVIRSTVSEENGRVKKKIIKSMRKMTSTKRSMNGKKRKIKTMEETTRKNWKKIMKKRKKNMKRTIQKIGEKIGRNITSQKMMNPTSLKKRKRTINNIWRDFK
ncbi:MAG: hypothetical protein PWP19_788 [Thermococcaceae archaeon]|nr:hypothetical protein [Thermococcaceae archaeon]